MGPTLSTPRGDKYYNQYRPLCEVCPRDRGKVVGTLQGMQEFDFEIIHREGKKNQNADAISRFPYVDEQTQSPSPALVSALDVDHEPESHGPLLECDSLAEVANDAADVGKDEGSFLELNLEYAQAPHIVPIDQVPQAAGSYCPGSVVPYYALWVGTCVSTY